MLGETTTQAATTTTPGAAATILYPNQASETKAPQVAAGGGTSTATPQDPASPDKPPAATDSDKDKKAPAEGDTAKPPEKPAGPPEKYELKLPEQSPLSADHLDKIAAEARERGLSNEDAQKLVERDHAIVAGYQTQQTALVNKNIETWQNDLRKEFGSPDKLNEAGELGYRAASHYFGEPFIEMLKKTGLSNYPDFFRGLAKMGREMADDSMVNPSTRGSHAKQPTDAATVMYGATTKGTG